MLPLNYPSFAQKTLRYQVTDQKLGFFSFGKDGKIVFLAIEVLQFDLEQVKASYIEKEMFGLGKFWKTASTNFLYIQKKVK